MKIQIQTANNRTMIFPAITELLQFFEYSSASYLKGEDVEAYAENEDQETVLFIIDRDEVPGIILKATIVFTESLRIA
jgi:TFIIF-interacting CTD phosphatase-like protein